MARRERNIYKRKDGRYEARYIRARDENGKPKYHSVYAQSYAKVKIKLNEAKSKAMQHSAFQTQSKHLVVTELENYLHCIRNQVKESTYCLYQRQFEKHILSYFKNIRCSQMTLDTSQNFIDKLIENGLSVVTAQSVFSLVKNGLKHYPQDIFAVKWPKHIAKKVEVFSRDEQRRLEIVAKTSNPVNKIAIILCLYTGIRVGELCGLLWTDIDFERQLLRVQRTVQRINTTSDEKKTKVVCLSPKSDTSQRDIPLPNS